MTTPSPSESFTLADFYGEVVTHYKPSDLEAEVRRLADPAVAEETIHWGRNYLFRTSLATPSGRIDVVVKQFRNQGLRVRLTRRWRASKAARSFASARALASAGLKTPEAVLLIESRQPGSPSCFVTRYLPGTVEARYLFRAANLPHVSEAFPEVDFETFLASLGRLLGQMHERCFFHRDLSIGNVLLKTGVALASKPANVDLYREALYLVDLNRARFGHRLSLSQRTRDLCRLPILQPDHRRIFLESYWGAGRVTFWRRALFLIYQYGFRLKVESKKKVRGVFRRFLDLLRPRRAYPHIPAAPHDVSVRDKSVWDHLSDQPHQHAGRFEKLTVRLTDAPSHARQTWAFLAAVPRIWRRYRRLKQELYRREVPWGGAGVCIRPLPEAPQLLLAALDELGVDKVLLRLHPWSDDHRAEEELARELHQRGYELAFALPQNRELVRDPARWRHQIAELAERFTPYGRHFQIGQAINRSKWGIWNYSEYISLANSAAEIFARYPDVEILGPSVIDFELHVTAAVLNSRSCNVRFDAMASLLYVDRRGAPENSQMGFDTVEKVVLLQAIAETARNCAPRSWITEVNWPLWEGPHSPAGRSVSVDEATQADYLARYFLLTLTTGMVERVYWWQLLARGYGLLARHNADGRLELRRRPSFTAFATLVRELAATSFVGPLPVPPGAFLFLFRRSDGAERVVGWCRNGRCRVSLPRPATLILERDGTIAAKKTVCDVELSPSVRYFHL